MDQMTCWLGYAQNRTKKVVFAQKSLQYRCKEEGDKEGGKGTNQLSGQQCQYVGGFTTVSFHRGGARGEIEIHVLRVQGDVQVL